METSLPENHPNIKRIIEAARYDVTFAAEKSKDTSLSEALSAAQGKAPEVL